MEADTSRNATGMSSADINPIPRVELSGRAEAKDISAKKILITGADGFVGRTLVRLLEETFPNSELYLLDREFKTQYMDARTKIFTGDFFDPIILHNALANGVDIVFHLASIPGGAAERDYAAGKRVNLDGTIELFESLRQLLEPPIVVFASTIAVYGSPLPNVVDSSTSAKPNLSYGTQKYIGELLVEDYSRRGFFDGRALRLPGIVARPPETSGMISAFMSDIMHNLAAGKKYVCPVSAESVMWWMSAICCAQNFIHAATMPAPEHRVTLLPALRASVKEIVAGLAELYGNDRLELVRYEANEQIEKAFGRFPPMFSGQAEALGFKHDGSVMALIQNALAEKGRQ